MELAIKIDLFIDNKIKPIPLEKNVNRNNN